MSRVQQQLHTYQFVLAWLWPAGIYQTTCLQIVDFCIIKEKATTLQAYYSTVSWKYVLVLPLFCALKLQLCTPCHINVLMSNRKKPCSLCLVAFYSRQWLKASLRFALVQLHFLFLDISSSILSVCFCYNILRGRSCWAWFHCPFAQLQFLCPFWCHSILHAWKPLPPGGQHHQL